PALERAGYFHRAVVDLRDSLALALGRWVGVGVCTALTAAALAAVQLLPALEAAGEASRGAGVPAAEILKASLPTLLNLAGPPVAGFGSGFWEVQSGVGMIWFVAALLAPVLGGGRSRFHFCVWLSLLAFA